MANMHNNTYLFSHIVAVTTALTEFTALVSFKLWTLNLSFLPQPP